jgi:hypothetical protein
MVLKNMEDHLEIWKIIKAYYKEPLETAAMVRTELAKIGIDEEGVEKKGAA